MLRHLGVHVATCRVPRCDVRGIFYSNKNLDIVTSRLERRDVRACLSGHHYVTTSETHVVM